MKLLYLFIHYFFTASLAFPQEYKFQFSFGDFNNAEAFYLNLAGQLYIADSGSDEIYKYDTLGTFMKEAGGYGWENDSFDDPVDIFASPLNVFVTDKNNHRIQQYDKDLNFVSLLYTKENDNMDEQFGYPLSCALSPQGDLYILDSENRRIVKFDMFGNYVQNFGGYDAGEYSLSSPVRLAVSPIGYVYVLDQYGMVVFDQYGNGISEIPVDEGIISLNIIFNQLTLNSNSYIYNVVLNSSDNSMNKLSLTGFSKLPDIRASLIYNNKLFVLTQNEVLVFEKEL